MYNQDLFDLANLDGDNFTQELLDYVEEAANRQLEIISDERGVSMFREFTELVSDWHPDIRSINAEEDPISVVFSVLLITNIYQKLFRSSYNYTSKKLDAETAIRNAFENS